MRPVDDYVTLLLDEPHKKNMEMLDSYDARLTKFQETRPDDLSKYGKHMKSLERFNQALDALKFNLSLDVIVGKITDDLAQMQEDWLTKKGEAYDAIDADITKLKEEIEANNKAHNQAIYEANKNGNSGFVTLESKRKILEGYSDKIFDISSQYGLSTSDVNIDETIFTTDELGKLYDEYIAYMKKEERDLNPIQYLRRMCPDVMMQGIILLVILFICFTPILNIISIAFIGALVANQVKEVSRAKYYSILLAITFNVKPENMGYVELDESLLLPEEITDEMLDTDERFNKFIEMYTAIEDTFEETNPTLIQTSIMAEYASKQPALQEKLKEYKIIFENKVFRIKSDVSSEIAFLNKEYDRLRKEHKFLGQRFSNSLVFNGKYSLGLHDECIDEYVDTGHSNIVIRPSADTELMNKFLRVMIVNAWSNVCPGKLKINVYDPNNFGRSIMPLYSAELNEYINFFNDKLETILDDCIDYVQDNFKLMAGKTIEEYNAICEKTGKTPIEYKLLVILSQPKTIEEDEKLQNFFEYSATGGTYIWVVSDTMMSKDAYVFRKPFEGVSNPIVDVATLDWCEQARNNYITAIENAKPKGLLWSDFINNVVPEDKTWTGDASKYIDFYPGYEEGDPSKFKPYTVGNDGNIHAIGVGTSGAGKSVFLNHLIGTMCRKFDPTQLELWLCDFKGVEFTAYMKAPRTKATWLCRPIKAEKGYEVKADDEMQEVLGYYDYNEETKIYSYSKEPTDACKELHIFTQEIKNGKPKAKNGKEVPPTPKPDTEYEPNIQVYSLPHIAACLCTSDGAFATSLFKAYRNKADARYEDMKILQVKNMPGWNSRVKGLLGTRKPQELIEAHQKETGFNPIWTEADLWPRVLFICDEFQVIFQKADDKDVDSIKEDITQISKVARACGMHIFFTSQSMKGTISSDTLANFSLRFALRCEPEVSQDIINSTRASDIKEPYGYLIVKSLEMKTPEEQKRYKTPFLADKPGSGKETSSELFDNIKYLNDLAIERGFPERNVISYEEATKHPIQELIDTYKNPLVAEKLPDSGVFFLGNRMAYDENKAPDNIIIAAKNNSNIMSVCGDYTDYVLWFNQLMCNIQNNKVPGTVIINSQVEDLAYITDAESYITNDQHKYLLSSKNKCAYVIDWMYKLLEARRAKNKKDTPVWIFLLGWDKGSGFGIETDISLRTRMNAFLQTAGEYHIHVIFINTGMTGISPSTTGACAYQIAAKCTLDDSTSCIGTKQASLYYSGMPTGWIFSKNNGIITRDKLYISEIKREITSAQIVI